MQPTPPWQAHCDIAVGLKRRFGTPVALDYLIGEKFIGFLREAATRDDLKAQIPQFADGIRQRFDSWELEGWFTKERKPPPVKVPVDETEFDPELEADFAEAGLKRLFLVEDASKWLLA